jgi:hypothetical protein
MKGFSNGGTFVIQGIGRFFMKKHCRRLVYLFLLAAPALVDFFSAALVRRTFVFYDLDTGEPVVEERMLARLPPPIVPEESPAERNIRRYVEEALLGPVSPEAAPLFPREAGLRSLFYRDGVVYVDFSQPAALPVSKGGDVFRNLYVLNAGLRRTFAFVRDVRLFIDGNEAFFERFRGMFTNGT